MYKKYSYKNQKFIKRTNRWYIKRIINSFLRKLLKYTTKKQLFINRNTRSQKKSKRVTFFQI